MAELMANPFVSDQPVAEPGRFVGREHELKTLISLVQKGGAVAITGERKVGKTSLLRYILYPEVQRMLGLQDRFILVYTKLHILGEDLTPDHLLQSFLADFSEKYDDPELSSLALDLSKRNSLGTSAASELFKRVYSKRHRLVFLFDDLERQATDSGLDYQQIFPFYIGLVQEYQFSLITASRLELPNLAPGIEGSGEPWFHFFKPLYLAFFDQGEADQLLSQYLSGGNTSFTAEERARLVSLSGGQPYLLQLAAGLLFDLYQQGSEIDQREAELANSFRAQAEPLFSDYWSASSEPEQTALAILAGVPGHDQASQVSNPTDALTGLDQVDKQALARLEHRGLLRRTDGKAALFTPAFGEWIVNASRQPVVSGEEGKPVTIELKTAEAEAAAGTPSVEAPPPTVEAVYQEILAQNANFVDNDRLGSPDRLNYQVYADAFAAILTNPETQSPLTIGIYASWGVGKSKLMAMIQKNLSDYKQAGDAVLQEIYQGLSTADRLRLNFYRFYRLLDLPLMVRRVASQAASPKADNPLSDLNRWSYGRRIGQWLAFLFSPVSRGIGRLAAFIFDDSRIQQLLYPEPGNIDYLCVNFNAWVYSGSDNLWVGLITRMYTAVEKYFGQWRTAYFRLGQSFRKSVRRVLGLLAVYGLLAVLLSLILDFQNIVANITVLKEIFSDLGTALVQGGGLLAVVTSVLAIFPEMLRALRDLGQAVVFARSEQLRNLSARPDFKSMVGYMADIKAEIRLISSLLQHGKDGRPARLVIFIDDLDRCPPERAVDVLEAIMLLLADEDSSQFFIFLGLDARVITKAIEKRYGEVLAKAGINGYEYLDKIVQIPFRIPPSIEEEKKEYITSLLWRSEKDRQEIARLRQDDEAKQKQSASAALDAARVGVSGSGSAQPERTVPSTEGELGGAAVSGQEPAIPPAEPSRPPVTPGEHEQATITAPPEPAKPPPTLTREVPITLQEQQVFERFSAFLASNPRRIKRMVNIYRLVRLLKVGINQPDRMIKLIILCEQWPYRMGWLIQIVEDNLQDLEVSSNSALRERVMQLPLVDVFTSVCPRVEEEEKQSQSTFDGDRELFDQFMRQEPLLKAADLVTYQKLLFNLNPAIQSEVLKAILENPERVKLIQPETARPKTTKLKTTELKTTEPPSTQRKQAKTKEKA